MDGEAGRGYEIGRLEIFRKGFWSNICDSRGFTPQAAMVACRILGYDGGASLDVGEVWQPAHDLPCAMPVSRKSIAIDARSVPPQCWFHFL